MAVTKKRKEQITVNKTVSGRMLTIMEEAERLGMDYKTALVMFLAVELTSMDNRIKEVEKKLSISKK